MPYFLIILIQKEVKMDKQVLGQLSYGLFVLTTKSNQKHNGCIINTAFQITEQPCQLCIVVNKSSYSHELLIREKVFNISILNEEADFNLVKHFGFQSGRVSNKFENFKDCALSANRLLYITKGCNGYISVNINLCVDLSTHTMFIGEITDMVRLNQIDSVTYSYYHAHIKPTKKSDQQNVYRCSACGYEYIGDKMPDDFICPWCGLTAEAFEKVDK